MEETDFSQYLARRRKILNSYEKEEPFFDTTNRTQFVVLEKGEVPTYQIEELIQLEEQKLEELIDRISNGPSNVLSLNPDERIILASVLQTISCSNFPEHVQTDTNNNLLNYVLTLVKDVTCDDDIVIDALFLLSRLFRENQRDIWRYLTSFARDLLADSQTTNSDGVLTEQNGVLERILLILDFSTIYLGEDKECWLESNSSNRNTEICYLVEAVLERSLELLQATNDCNNVHNSLRVIGKICIFNVDIAQRYKRFFYTCLKEMNRSCCEDIATGCLWDIFAVSPRLVMKENYLIDFFIEKLRNGTASMQLTTVQGIINVLGSTSGPFSGGFVLFSMLITKAVHSGRGAEMRKISNEISKFLRNYASYPSRSKNQSNLCLILNFLIYQWLEERVDCVSEIVLLLPYIRANSKTEIFEKTAEYLHMNGKEDKIESISCLGEFMKKDMLVSMVPKALLKIRSQLTETSSVK